MEVIRTDDFEEALIKLPAGAKRLYAIQEKRFLADPGDPRLHLKRLRELGGVFSFRITRRYRALCYFHTDNRVVFFAIGHRKDIYRT